MLKIRTLTSGFGVYFDPSKTTSGQRFFAALCQELNKSAVPFDRRPRVVLFNISASWREVVKAKFRGQKIVLRVDGLYFDKLSPRFLKNFCTPLRWFLRLGIRYPKLHSPLAHLANLLDQNYKAFFRIYLADYIIYQSDFSYRVHQVYFPNKKSSIIINGAHYLNLHFGEKKKDESTLSLVTIYDDWKPAKRIYDVLCFLRWLNERKNIVTLSILGYTGNLPEGSPPDMRELLENSTFVNTLPRFSTFDGRIVEVLAESDCYITFSYRDPCPNALVEAMAHGLPVLATASGGIPDIVGDAGRLISSDDFSQGFFSDHRFGSDFPTIDFIAMETAMFEIWENLPKYRQRVTHRFTEELDINNIAIQYQRVLETLNS